MNLVRRANYFPLPQANLTIFQKGAYYLKIKIFNNLLLQIKNVASNIFFFYVYTLIHLTQLKSTLANR
jgi:hypothetical protein